MKAQLIGTRSFFQTLSFLFLISCNFTPEGGILTSVTAPSTTGLNINLDNFPAGQILLKEKTNFQYTVVTGGKLLIESRVIFNNNLIWSSKSATTTFQLDPANLNTGTYPLRIEFTVPSGSGSLADKSNLEILYVKTEKTVVVDNSVVNPDTGQTGTSISSVKDVNHSVQINWGAYNNFNFKKYQLIRTDFDDTGKQTTGRVFPDITDPTITSYFDDQYINGKSQYTITVFTTSKSSISAPFNYQNTYSPNIAYTLLPDGKVKVTWNSLSALSSNFSTYQLDELADGTGDYLDGSSLTFTNVLDTAVTFTPKDFGFGSAKKLRLTILSSSSINYLKTYKIPMRFGDPFPVFQEGYIQPHFSTVTQSYYFNRHYQFCKADINGNLLDSLREYFNAYSNGDITLAVMNDQTGIISKDDYSNYFVDLQTMKATVKTSLPNGTVFDISNDNTVLEYIPSQPTALKVITIQGQELLNTGSGGGSNTFNLISSDNKFIVAGRKLYKYDGAAYQLLSSVWYPFAAINAAIPALDPSSIIVSQSDQINKYDLNTRAVIKSAPGYHGPFSYDPISRKLSCFSNTNTNQLAILNEDLTLYKAITVNPRAGTFYLVNSNILCTSGTKIKLSDLP